MTKSVFVHAKITGVVTVVPKDKIALDDEKKYYENNEAKLERLKKTVGLNTRCVVKPGTTAGDLCFQAAEHLIDGMGINTSDIDALICVLDCPDYKIPPTSCILHGKLNLPKTCMAFDISHGCAGYVYGLFVASSLIESRACRKVLLLVGDTKSRTINIKDRISAPLFGDGASATLLEYSEEEISSSFVIGADGSLFENIMIPAGGARMPCSVETRIEKADEFGNIRSLENFTMNGKAVFDFTMKNIPSSLTAVMELAGVQPEQIDFVVLHQANKSILTNIAVRSGFRDMTKVPSKTLEKYGNLSVASIPAVFNDQLFSELSTSEKRVLISGFGVGLAWGSAVLNLDTVYCPQPFEYQE